MKQQRDEGIESEHRARTPEQNMATFDEMLRGSPRWSGEREDWSQTGLDSLSFLPYLSSSGSCDAVESRRSFLVSIANEQAGAAQHCGVPKRLLARRLTWGLEGEWRRDFLGSEPQPSSSQRRGNSGVRRMDFLGSELKAASASWRSTSGATLASWTESG